MNRASSVAAARAYGEQWLERYWAEPDATRVSEYGDETVGALLAAGFTLRDISDMQGAGVSERDALSAAAVRTGQQTTQRTGLVPEYDAVYYLNDLLSPHTEVLMTSSAVYGETYYTYGLGRLSSDDGEGQKQSYLYDGRGSVTMVVSRLEVICKMGYTDYGAVVGEPPHKLRSFYGYNGEEHDPLTGLQYLRARYYDAATGSFTSRDPFEGTLDVPLSQHGFTYAHNNPVNYTDPSGMIISGGRVKFMNDGGGGVSKTVRAIRAEHEYQKAKRVLSMPKPPMARPGTELAASLMPDYLAYQKAQTMIYLREGCRPSDKRAVSQTISLSHSYYQIGTFNSNNVLSYGGNQGWWNKEHRISRDYVINNYGCGLIALSDLLLYLSETNNAYETDFIEQFYDGNSFMDRNDYINYVEQMNMFPSLNQRINGVARPFGLGLNGFSLATKFNQYARKYGLDLKATWADTTSDTFWDSVEEMLNNDIPVIMSIGPNQEEIVFYNAKTGEPIERNGHYFTVTGIIYPDEGNNYNNGMGTLLNVATWGKNYYVSLDQYEQIRTEELSWIGGFWRDLTTNILVIQKTNESYEDGVTELIEEVTEEMEERR